MFGQFAQSIHRTPQWQQQYFPPFNPISGVISRLNFQQHARWRPQQPQNFIPFDQSFDVIYKLNRQQYNTLSNINQKYGGLCEIICNFVLINQLLGRGDHVNYLRDRITVEKLNEKTIKSSHMLTIYSLFRKAIACLFGIFPDNIFSCTDQWRLVKKGVVNRQILAQGLSTIPEGTTLKLEVFSKNGIVLSGHSLLIKKTGRDSFIFFDPNVGERRGLNLQQLSDEIDGLLKGFNASNILLIRGNDYLKRLRKAGLSLGTNYTNRQQIGLRSNRPLA